MDERLQIIERFEKLKENNQDFYKRNPRLLEQLDRKIEGLKLGCDYTVENAQWVIGYIGAQITNYQVVDFERQILLNRFRKNTLTQGQAKEMFWGLINGVLDFNEDDIEFKYDDELTKEENERLRKEQIESMKRCNSLVKERLSYLDEYRGR